MMSQYDGMIPQGVAMAPQACCCSYPNCQTCRPKTSSNPYYPQTASPHSVQHYLSIQEQMGTDPQTKLAAAINRLCDLIEKSGDGGSNG